MRVDPKCNLNQGDQVLDLCKLKPLGTWPTTNASVRSSRYKVKLLGLTSRTPNFPATVRRTFTRHTAPIRTNTPLHCVADDTYITIHLPIPHTPSDLTPLNTPKLPHPSHCRTGVSPKLPLFPSPLARHLITHLCFITEIDIPALIRRS